MSSESTALALPADIMHDLLRQQQESITTQLDLPRIQIAGAAAGVFKFPDSGPVATFDAVILGAHPKNVLWTEKMDPNKKVEGEAARPACSSPDGKTGIPKVGFKHAALGGRAAREDDRISCASCPYNKFGSGDTFIADRNKKGKAVSNQKVLYVLLPDRTLPFELTLSTMSISSYDEYVMRLTGRGLPVQTVLTRFALVERGGGSAKYSVATFADTQKLGQEQFNHVMAQYRAYTHLINPKPPEVVAAAAPAAVVAQQPTGSAAEDGPDFEVAGDDDAELDPPF